MAALRAGMAKGASDVQSHARRNAPWTDRTSNARNGLFAKDYQEGKKVGIVLYHTMEYGKWLEVRWGGRYSTINPTIRAKGPAVMASVGAVMKRVT